MIFEHRGPVDVRMVDVTDQTEAEKIARAVSEGYPDVDERCPKCQTVFKNYHHLIRCDERPCPMSDGKTLFDRLFASTE